MSLFSNKDGGHTDSWLSGKITMVIESLPQYRKLELDYIESQNELMYTHTLLREYIYIIQAIKFGEKEECVIKNERMMQLYNDAMGVVIE